MNYVTLGPDNNSWVAAGEHVACCPSHWYSMSKNRRGRQTVSFIDKIADQSISIVLTFLFVTALIGGSGYILFQYPVEKDAIDRKRQEHANGVAPIRRFNDML